MNDDLSPVLAFYERCGPDAIGHCVVQIGDDEAEMVEKFIVGMCSDSERRQIAQFLQLHPELIRPIADRIKADRKTPETVASSK